MDTPGASASDENYLRQLEAVCDNATVALFVMDARQHCTYMNPAAEKLTATRARRSSADSTSRRSSPRNTYLARQMSERKLRDPTPTVYELDMLTKGGRRLTLEVSTRVSYEDGRPAAVEGVARDVTERRRAEEEREKLRMEVMEAQRSLLAELSTPLIPIREDVVVLPLIGAMNTERAAEMLESLLKGVTTSGAKVAIVDVTGVQEVDTHVANMLVRAAQSVRLLGAEVVNGHQGGRGAGAGAARCRPEGDSDAQEPPGRHRARGADHGSASVG